MSRDVFALPPSGLPVKEVLELANLQLESARKANTTEKVLILCDLAKELLKDAENILVKIQTHNLDLANAYHNHGVLQEEVGNSYEAKKSYRKAERWGYVRVTSESTDSSQVTNPSDTVLGLDIGPSVHQDVANDATSTEVKNQMSAISKVATPIQAKVVRQDLSTQSIKITLPGPFERIVSTSQLAYCLSLLASEEGFNKNECDWLQATKGDPDEQKRLTTIATDIIRAFVREDFKTSGVVAEAVSLAAILEQDDFRKLLRIFVNEIDKPLLLKENLLNGLAHLIKNAKPGNIYSGDLVKILELLSARLKDTHAQSLQHIYRLTVTVTSVLDSMVDAQVDNLKREQLHTPLSQHLKSLQKSSDPCLVYYAAYSYQALQHIPDDETFLKATIRRTGKIVKGISGVVSAARALDIDGFIKGLRSIGGGITGVVETIGLAHEAYKNAKDFAKSGQDLLEYLKEGLSFDQKRAWYPALHGLDTLVQEGKFAEFEKLIRETPCRRDIAFQWGVCQRLGKIAATRFWGDEIRQQAVSLLREMYSDDVEWGRHVSVKQWILQVLGKLSEISEGPVSEHAKKQLQDLETDGDSKKRAFYQVCIKEDRSPFLLEDPLSIPKESQLLDIVQGKPDVESSLRQLKQERLKDQGQDVYISPRAKLSRAAKEEFDLAVKLQEFLNSNKKVFLLLGDSGGGKSTFNRALEIDLWNKFNKTSECIPLFIHLPTIENPEQDLIAERLRRANFTENQIKELKLYHKFILICDGYDEISQTRNLYMSNQMNQPGQWNVQMVISYRTESAGVDYRDYFRPTYPDGRGNPGLFQEAILTPFNKNQIQEYIDQYVSLKKPSWGITDYQLAFMEIPNMQDLVTNPFLLKIAVDVLPTLVDTKDDFSKIRITRVGLYDGFVEQWIDRNRIRLREVELSPRDREALNMLSSDFNQYSIEYLKELAAAIYDKQEGNALVKYSEYRDRETWKEQFFDNSDGKNLLREAIPLIRDDERYRFIHRSILEYGLALAIFDPNEQHESMEPEFSSTRRESIDSIESFEEQILPKKPPTAIEQPLLESPLAKRSLVNEQSISRFLVERAQQQPLFKKQLHAVIERSKTEKKTRIAASNAITILVRAGVQFNGADLQGIQIPGADLSYGFFDSAQLNGADLRKVGLRNVWMRRADLSGSQMDGAQFGELPLIKENTVITSCAYSQDGGILAAGLYDGNIHLYDTSSWEKIQTLSGHTDYVGSLVFSKSNDLIASGSWDHTVRVWDPKTGKCIKSLEGHTNDVNCVSFSPCGDQLASGSADETVIVWNVDSGEPVHTLEGQEDSITSVLYSPNGDQISSGVEDLTVWIWDPRSGDCLSTIDGQGDRVLSFAYLANEDHIASGIEGETVLLWDVKTGNMIRTLQGHSGRISSVVYSPSGDQVASGSYDKSVRLWNIETGDCINTFQGHSEGIYCLAYSPNGAQVASGSGDATMRLWNVNAVNFIHATQGHTDLVTSIAFSPKGGQVCSASIDHTVRLWETDAGHCVHTLRGHRDWVKCIAYSPNGNHIASGSDDKTARSWSVETGSCIHTFEGHSKGVTSIVYSPDGNQIASGSDDFTVRLWNVNTGQCVSTLQGHSRWVTSIMYTLDGNYLVSCGGDNTVRAWSVETGKCTYILDDHSNTVNKVVASPKGNQFASGGWDLSVRLWNSATGTCIRILQGHTDVVLGIVYSPNGDLIASFGVDMTVRLWDVETGNCVHTFEGHSEPVISVAYSSDGGKIISGSQDQTVRLWDVETGKCLSVISGFNGDVSSVVWEDGLESQYFVTGSSDKSVRRWQVIKKGEEYVVYLSWSSSHDALTVKESSFIDIQGLSQANRTLLSQRNAIVA